jgi:ABC-type oligopeptide transport system substrate-binding subunit
VRPVTSSDAVFTVQRVCQNKTASPLIAPLFVIQGCREIYSLPADGVTQELLDQTIGVRVLNDTVVEFKLNQDAAIFPTLLSMPILAPVPADLLEQASDAWTQPDTIWTSGPYLLQPTIPPEEGYTLIASQGWPLERSGNVDVVQISLSDDPAQAYQAWNDGQIAMAIVPPDLLAATPFGDDPRFWLHALPAAMGVVPSYDTPPMERAGLRRALSLSIDRQSLIDSVLEPGGHAALPASSLVPPGMVGAPPYGTVGSTFDPEAARAALAEAGFPNCVGMPTLTLLTDTSDVSLAIANNIAGQWRTVLGCFEESIVVEQRSLQEVLIALHEPPTPIQRQFRPLRPGAITLNWQADYLDAQHWLADIIGCREDFPRAYLNSARPCIDGDSDLLRAAGIHELTSRATLYSQIEDVFFGPEGEMPLIPVYFYARPLAFQPWVEFAPLHAGPLRFDQWRIDPTQRP